jgi:hypothetical protein
VVCHTSKLLGIHTKLSCHLYVGMGEMESLPGIYPCLKLRRKLPLVGHIITP